MSVRIEREKTFHNKVFQDHSRDKVGKYYQTVNKARDFYRKQLLINGKAKSILEYGCGPGSEAFRLAEGGARVTGIDISDVAIEQAIQEAEKKVLLIDFKIMNAEDLNFPENSFDTICGSGILHHLDLKVAYAELAKVMRKAGKAVFFEPLGHNPFINFYRRITPKMRTDDEHPLMMEDLALAKEYFGHVDVHYFNLTTFGAIPFRNMKGSRYLLNTLNGLDQAVFKMLPFIRKYAWIVVIILKEPKY